MEHSKDWKDSDRAMFEEECDSHNFLKVGMYFDVLAWWQENEAKFPRVFPSAR
jgi:hypothetical protein